ncbi:MAG: DNA-binding protein [Clostridiales bacterium]|nr:DNA-binding protein [Clostridiales bacterium]
MRVYYVKWKSFAGGECVEEIIELGWLLDFYGPLLTEKRRQIVDMRVNEDMTLAEIAETCQMTRQGAYDAFAQARKQLKEYENALGLLERYRKIHAELDKCLEALEGVKATPETQTALDEARRALGQIERIER